MGGEREGEDFTDNSIEKRNSEIAIFRKHVGHVAVHGILTEVHSGTFYSKVFMNFSTVEGKYFTTIIKAMKSLMLV
jgi:hypothetical protein